ncbi:hypothetical protein HN51_054470 [Arachis hypogaea]
MAKDVIGLVSMYRITGDEWDTWWDVKGHFDVTRDFATSNLIGASGLNGKFWPDLDMLPFGWLTDPDNTSGDSKVSPNAWRGFAKNDPTTYGLITNPILLEINSFSPNNMEACELHVCNG